MSDEADRERLATSIQESNPESFEGVLIGWVVVAEWMDDEGKRWLTRVDGNSLGEGITAWQREGYLHNALNTDWDEE